MFMTSSRLFSLDSRDTADFMQLLSQDENNSVTNKINIMSGLQNNAGYMADRDVLID